MLQTMQYKVILHGLTEVTPGRQLMSYDRAVMPMSLTGKIAQNIFSHFNI